MKTLGIGIGVTFAIMLLCGGAFIWALGLGNKDSVSTPVGNVQVVDGKQIIEITAKWGYLPKVSVAKGGVPTILRFKTQGAFDCSSAVRIPSMGITKSLPQTGTTDIDVGTAQAGVLQGSCSMGMFPFSVKFQS